MKHKSNDTVRTVLLIAGGIAGLIILLALVLRILMAPLYEEMAMASQRNNQGEVARHQGGSSSGGGTDVNVDLAGLPWLCNWALGWAWGGPGWHNNGWGWNNWGWGGWNNNNGGNWNGGGRTWNGNMNDTVNRTVNDISRGGANNIERNVERAGGGNIGRELERSGGGNIERNVERGMERGGGGGGINFHGRK